MEEGWKRGDCLVELPVLGQEQDLYQLVYCQIVWEVIDTSRGNILTEEYGGIVLAVF